LDGKEGVIIQGRPLREIETRRQKGGTSMAEILKKSILVGLGALDLTREKVKETVDRLVAGGKIDRKHATEVIEELVERGEKESKKIGGRLEKIISATLKRTRLATREQLQTVEKRLKAVEEALKEIAEKK
jgi:polyhydroxyalkanoate synthesis regulator phasin